MRIVSSTAALASDFSVQESFKTSVSRETMVSNGGNVTENRIEVGAQLDISEEGMSMFAAESGKVNSSLSVETLSSKEELKLRLLTRLLEGLTGRKMPMRILPHKWQNAAAERIQLAPNTSRAQIPNNKRTTTTTLESEYSREDRMNFSAEAQVLTADGMKIDIAVNLSMSRSFATSQSISWSTEVQLCDPLVFNFNGKGVELSGETFSFDIDNDGTSDQISLLAEGNGFLALDLNGDGHIGDGGEMFGASSGNGFTDLAAHDADSNGWIDENDEVFDKLRIMFMDKDGNQRLVALGELGIGAVYLGNTQSNFEIRDMQNESQGVITHTGFFLYESGNAGLVQNVNFRMYDMPMNEPLLYDAAV